MSELVRSVILGIIQGLTEFLPVSSSGHLELAKAILGDTSVGEQSLFFTIMVHAATALSTLYVFRKDVWEILKGLFSTGWNEDKAFAVNVVISMVPAALVGFFMEDMIAMLFQRRIAMVGIMLIVTAILLYIADFSKTTEKSVSPLHALIIGVAQAIAILPGISRSGATIATSVILGIDRYKAARFSFLMVVPLILGKIAYDLLKGELTSVAMSDLTPVLAGSVAAFITGAAACTWMIALVRNSKLRYFSYYCLVVGILAIISVFL